MLLPKNLTHTYTTEVTIFIDVAQLFLAFGFILHEPNRVLHYNISRFPDVQSHASFYLNADKGKFLKI